MDPIELRSLDAAGFCRYLSESIDSQDISGTSGALAELESRFGGASSSAEASARFVEDYLPVTDQPCFRALRIENPLARYAERVEFLIEMAGDRSRQVSGRDLMIQMVDSRRRGRKIVAALVDAPPEGIKTDALAKQLGTTAPNLSPVLALFQAHGIVARGKRGTLVFNSLSQEARAVFAAPEPAIEPREVIFRFGGGPVPGLRAFRPPVKQFA